MDGNARGGTWESPTWEGPERVHDLFVLCLHFAWHSLGFSQAEADVQPPPAKVEAPSVDVSEQKGPGKTRTCQRLLESAGRVFNGPFPRHFPPFPPSPLSLRAPALGSPFPHGPSISFLLSAPEQAAAAAKEVTELKAALEASQKQTQAAAEASKQQLEEKEAQKSAAETKLKELEGQHASLITGE